MLSLPNSVAVLVSAKLLASDSLRVGIQLNVDP